MKKVFYSLLITVVLCSCANDNDQADRDAAPAPPAKEAVLDFTNTDSLELIYYPDPGEQRKYAFGFSSDTQLIASLVRDLHQPAVEASACPHYKKAYLYNSGEVYKTVYISDSCRYLAFVVNGRPVYRSLSDNTRSNLARAFQSVIRTPIK